MRQVKFYPGVALVVGSIIGSGLFMKPASIAALVASPELMLAIWAIAGVFTLTGALVFAELGAMLPVTGGIYAFFKYIFGDFFAYLYGWAAFAVINTGGVAAIVYVCAYYADHFLHLPQLNTELIASWRLHLPWIGDFYILENIGVKMLAVGIVLVLTAMNARSLRAGTGFQVLSTALKLVVIGGLVLGIFLSGEGSISNWANEAPAFNNDNLLAGMMLALTGAFFAYDGWANLTFVAGEIDKPRRNIPRMLLTGVLTCVFVYLLVNLAYLYVLPIEEMAKSPLVAKDAASAAWGRMSGDLVAAMIVVSTLGAVNGNILACSRVTYAMSRDGLFPSWAGKANKSNETPANALWLHATWTCGFIITGTFDMLTDMFIFVTWIAYGLGAVGLFVLRKREPRRERPYKVWGYPIVPLLFIAFTIFYFVSTLYTDVDNYINGKQPVVNSLLGLLITALGIPVYFWMKKKRHTSRS